METILAQFVTWNNVINDYAVNVQNLLAPILGAMVAEVAISRNVDAVHLDLVTPFNKQRAAPQHHLLVEWMKNQDLRDADAALAQARLSLMEFLEGQADAAASAGRSAGAPGRLSNSNPFVVDVPRLARQDTSGAATLALLTEALGPGSSLAGSSGPSAQDSNGGGVERMSAGRRAGATAEAATTSSGSPARASDGGAVAGRPGSDGLPSGPGRPPGTAESASTDASDMPEPPQTLTQHLQHFNGCVATLQQHLGPNFGVYFHVTPAACAVRGRCAYVRLMRHSHPTKQAAAVSAGTPGTVDRTQQQQLLQKARTLGRQGQRAGPPGLAAAAAAAAVAAASPPPPLPSRAPSRIGSAASFSRISAGGTLRPQAPPADPPPPPGSAAAIFGEDTAPVTLVDVVYSGITDAIMRAERSVAVVGNELARLFEKYEPPLSLVEEPKHCRKLKTLPVAKEYVEANRKIQQLNAVLFKMAKAVAKTAWIYSTPLSMPDGTLGDVAQMVCEALRRVADTAWAMCKRHLESVHLVTLLTHHEPFTITPRFSNDDTTFRFELEVVVDQSLLMNKSFPDFLPPQIRVVWDSLLALAAVVQESRVNLAPLRQQYKRLHEEVREFYTLAPEAAKARRLSIVEAANVARVVNTNLGIIYEAEQVFEAYNRNVQRLVDAYSRAQREIKADLQLKLAELTTKLPRSIVKPSFSADMLALMRSSVNPTELAATMTLALTASNLDPAALSLMQQSLAMGAAGAATPQAGQTRGSAAAATATALAAAATGVPSVNPAAAGGGAVAALGGIGVLQQQQQQQQLAAAQMQQMQMQQAAAAAYGMYGMNGGTPMAGTAAAAAVTGPSAAASTTTAAAGSGAQPPPAQPMGAASRRGSALAPPADVPDLAAHGTAADYAAQLAMAQAYGYAYGNPYAAYSGYGSGTLGSISMGKSSHNLAAAMSGGAAGTAGGPAAAAAAAAGGTGMGTTGAAGQPGMVGAYHSAGYDANTIAMLAQMGYGGFSVGSTQPQAAQAQAQQAEAQSQQR